MTAMSPATIQILTALALGDNDASGLWRQLAIDSQGTVLIQERTFYYAMQRLERDGLIAAAPGGPAERRRYKLTLQARRLLQIEQVRVSRLSLLLRQRLI